MATLRKVIPNCSGLSTALLLEEYIAYIEKLRWQIADLETLCAAPAAEQATPRRC